MCARVAPGGPDEEAGNMETTPIRQDVANRLTERTRAAFAAGKLSVPDIFPEVTGEGTQADTIEAATRTVMAVASLAFAGLASPDALARSIRAALTVASATGYAVALDVYDERAAETFGALMSPGE
jgi:hypothetical protein